MSVRDPRRKPRREKDSHVRSEFPNPRKITAPDLARYLNVHRQTAYRMLREWEREDDDEDRRPRRTQRSGRVVYTNVNILRAEFILSRRDSESHQLEALLRQLDWICTRLAAIERTLGIRLEAPPWRR